MRRLGTVGGLALVVLGLYEALLYSPTGCLASTPQHSTRATWALRRILVSYSAS